MAQHILIAEDDDAIRRLLRLILESAGYVVCEATDGLAALSVLRTSPYRLVVVLSGVMRKLDGVALLGQVVGDADLATRHAYVLITASPETLSPAMTGLLESLSVPVISKPFKIDTLLSAIADPRRHPPTGRQLRQDRARRGTRTGQALTPPLPHDAPPRARSATDSAKGRR